MYFHDPSERATKELAPGVLARTFWGQNMTLALVDLKANATVPLHSHPHEQAGIVLQGELEFTIADETRLVKTGEIYTIPGGVEHGVKVGANDAQVLDIFSPIRDDFIY
jgi:quercetin dioxygenase-like cupin family protein